MIVRLTNAKARMIDRLFRLHRLRTDEIAQLTNIEESVVANTLSHMREMRRLVERKSA